MHIKKSPFIIITQSWFIHDQLVVFAWFLISLLLFPLPAKCQQENFKSNQKITSQNTSQDGNFVTNLLVKSEHHVRNFAYDSALITAMQALQIAQSTRNAKLIALAQHTVGNRYYFVNDLKNSIRYFQEALQTADLTKDSAQMAETSIDLGFTYAVNGRPDSALLCAHNALNYFSGTQNFVDISKCYRILGDVQYTLEYDEKAQYYYEQGIQILQQNNLNDSLARRELSVLTSNVAMVLAELKKLNEAEKYYSMSDSVAQLCYAQDISYGNAYGLSYVYIYAGAYEKAIRLATKAMQYYEATNDSYYLEGCWEGIGRAYLGLNQLDSANYYLKKAEASALKNNSYEFLKEVFLLLSEVYEKEQDFPLSLAYYKKYKAYADSLFTIQNIYQLNVLEVSNNISNIEEQKQLLLQKQEQDQLLLHQKSRNNLLITLAFSLAFLSAALMSVLYYQKRNKNRKLAEEVALQTQELNKTNAELKKANAELQEFAHISFHDLREPLRNISSFTKLMRKKGANLTPEELDDYTSIIETNTKQMQLLVYDVFEFVKVDEGNQKLDTFSPEDMLNDVIKVLESNFKEKDVIITKDVEVQTITSNKGMLSIALKNLLENAVKYNTSEQPRIHIQMHNGNDQYTWYVKDNGIGIERKYHKRIFEMFKRLHNREKYQGSGLGLSITKKIIEKLHGEIGVISEEGKGSTFWFRVPKLGE